MYTKLKIVQLFTFQHRNKLRETFAQTEEKQNRPTTNADHSNIVAMVF